MSQSVRHVFVVDDEELITESLTLILSREGFHVSSFTNPLEALERLKSSPPDLLITDVLMPQLSGIELAIQASKLSPACRILLLSGHLSTTGLLYKAQTDGHNFRLLQKPVHPNELLQEIQALRGGPAAAR